MSVRQPIRRLQLEETQKIRERVKQRDQRWRTFLGDKEVLIHLHSHKVIGDSWVKLKSGELMRTMEKAMEEED